MSVKAMTAVFETRGQQTAADRLVLLALADHTGADGANCRPGIDLCADYSDQSRSTTIRSIARLEGNCVAEDHDGCDCTHTPFVWVHRRPGRGSHYVLLIAGLDEPNPANWDCPVCFEKAVDNHRRQVSDRHRSPVEDPVDSAPDQSQAATTTPVSDWNPTSVTADTGGGVTADTAPVPAVTPDPSRSVSGSVRDPLPAAAGEQTRPDHQQLVDAIVDACHLERPLTPTAGSIVGKVAAQLAQVDATVTDIDLRAARLRSRWGRDAVTPTSLAKHWPSLGDPDNARAEDPAVDARRIAANFSGQPWDHVLDALRGRGFDDDVIAGAHDTWRQLQQEDDAA